MARSPRGPRTCWYCGRTLKGSAAGPGPYACAIHRDLLAVDPEAAEARRVAKDAPDPYAPLRKRPS